MLKVIALICNLNHPSVCVERQIVQVKTCHQNVTAAAKAWYKAGASVFFPTFDQTRTHWDVRSASCNNRNPGNWT